MNAGAGGPEGSGGHSPVGCLGREEEALSGWPSSSKLVPGRHGASCLGVTSRTCGQENEATASRGISPPPQKNPPEREGKERRKGEVTLLTQALRSATQPPGETQGDLVTLIML